MPGEKNVYLYKIELMGLLFKFFVVGSSEEETCEELQRVLRSGHYYDPVKLYQDITRVVRVDSNVPGKFRTIFCEDRDVYGEEGTCS